MTPVKTCYVQKPEEKDKKIYELEKRSNFFKKSSYSSFVFAPYTLISPNLHIIFFKNTYLGRSQRGALIFKIAKSLAINPRNGTLTETQKTSYVL